MDGETREAKETKEAKKALQVIDRLYPELYLIDGVKHHSKKHDKYGKLEDYFSRLEKFHKRVNEKPKYREDRIERLKLIYYKWCLIEKNKIPEAYYKHQEQMAFERGYGHIKINAAQKEELANEVVENQKKSLDTWIDYFLSDDSKFYPFWAKYWAFRGMLKLGYYDTVTGTYNKRTSKTTAPFAELNQEALAMAIELFIKSIQKERIEDQELGQIVKTNSFQKVYVYILKKLKNNSQAKENSNKGIWIKYNQGSDHMPLVESIKGRNTGWCTAGAKIAERQLSRGDFYVYYTLDNNGEYKIPRVAIRMENGSIAEIRGVAEKQNIESDMEKVVEEKIKEFPDAEKYKKKVSDMRRMTEIYQKHTKGVELSIEELRFLYELYSKIDGFGYGADPRINEIKKSRNIKKDLAKVFNCQESQIALRRKELTKETIYYQGNLNLNKIKNPKRLFLPKHIGGCLDLGSLTSAEGLVLPEYVGGYLDLRSLTSAEGLVLLEYISDSLYLNGLTSAKNITLPKFIGGCLSLSGLKSAEDLNLPEYIGIDLYLSGLTSAEGLVFPKYIGASLYLGNLISAEGLVFPEYVGGFIFFKNLTSAKNIKLPEYIYGRLELNHLTSVEGLQLPKYIGDGEVSLNYLDNIDGLIIPEDFDYNIYTKFGIINKDNIGEYRSKGKVC